MDACRYVMPHNGRGYALDVDGDYRYRPGGSPWCLCELPAKLKHEGYYWTYVDGRVTLIREFRLQKRWTAPKWMRIRRMWTYLIASSRVECEGVGFAWTPTEFYGWLCVEPVKLNAIEATKGEILARLAYQLDMLRPGAFMRLVGGWQRHRHMVARICGQKREP